MTLALDRRGQDLFISHDVSNHILGGARLDVAGAEPLLMHCITEHTVPHTAEQFASR